MKSSKSNLKLDKKAPTSKSGSSAQDHKKTSSGSEKASGPVAERLRVPKWAGSPKDEHSALAVIQDSVVTELLHIGSSAMYIFGKQADSDFVLLHPSISRHHAALVHRNDDGTVRLFGIVSRVTRAFRFI